MANDDGSAARAFHEATKHSLHSLQSHPHHLDWDNLPLPFKIYRGIDAEALPRSTARSALPALDAIAGQAPRRDPGEIPDRAALGRLLRGSLGILRRRRIADGSLHDFRAAPCTGALYHVDAYLVAGELPDMAAGVYHFGPHDFSLRRLRRGDWRAAVLAACGGADAVARAPLTVVLASTYWRNAWKYRARAYRHVFWDGGTVLAQLLAQASADGWTASVKLGFADRPIERLCALDPAREGVIALVPIGAVAAGEPAPNAAEPPPLRLETEPLSAREVDYREIREAHEAGVLDDGGEAVRWTANAPRAAPPAVAGDLVAIRGERAAAGDPLEIVVERRGSTRIFARRAVSRTALAQLLEAACAPLAADYRVEESRSLVDLHLVVHAVEGVAPGGYRWRPESAALERLVAGEHRREAGRLALGQALGADAAVDVYAIADLDAVLGALGTRGYRAATLDGGIGGGRLYLASYAQQLGATGLTFFDDDVARFFGLDPRRYGVMFLTAAGVPAAPRARA
ncbi:MAG: SagB family peptide dehydrogenase [Deltaproteobacteria bacterium]|nr:SagB family peptide dehydrogenase [Deltaproteobacteria bacterium]